MISKEEIRTALKNIAELNNLTGESVDLQVDELTYFLYHYQTEVVNAIQESNLSTAYLLNSKIRNCMNVMYSVYRGRNVRVNLYFENNTLIEKNKFDVLYTSNTFKVYAGEALTVPQSIENGNGYKEAKNIVGILSTTDLYEAKISVSKSNKYYIDAKINNELLSNLSEDIQVLIDGVEYPTTRNFYDHIQQAVPLKDNDAYLIGDTYYYVSGTQWLTMSYTDEAASALYKLGDLSSTTLLPKLPTEDKDSIFVLTIPDYGIRLYRRGYFSVNSEITIRALRYTTINDINTDEFSKIVIPGTILVKEGSSTGVNETDTMSIDNVVNKGAKRNGVIKEIDRDDEKSLLYQANLYQHMQSTILSNSDVNALFNEYFIENIRSSINWYNGDKNFNDGIIYIFYVPIIDEATITDSQVETFKRNYSSHYITANIQAVIGCLIEINVHLELYMEDTNEINDEIQAIYDNYANQLNDPTDWDSNILNYKQIQAEISKLNTVSYIDELQYVSYVNYYDKERINHPLYDQSTGVNKLPPTYVESESLGIKVPTYYKFNLEILYRNIYEKS